ncbi:hypothetical protein OIU77_008826 [Salix suchowensis]|uniref:Uncharacterized protein n=1 Tax=Salix suchowensis TaxID=1278906 RepID=A0ABQ9ADI6_9ROSI|nr:hypothetical protein OIU77_008826 [Salix suchowensis]
MISNSRKFNMDLCSFLSHGTYYETGRKIQNLKFNTNSKGFTKVNLVPHKLNNGPWISKKTMTYIRLVVSYLETS